MRPNVTREAALAQFRGRGPLRWVRTARLGPVRSLADVYIPFRLFRVHIETGTGTDTQLLALDLVRGSLDFYGFKTVPEGDELVPVKTRNCPPARLDEQQVQHLMRERVERTVFRRGFFRVRQLEIRSEPLADFCIPYWVAFSGWGDDVHLEAMDAVRRRMEGGKVRELLKEWIQGNF